MSGDGRVGKDVCIRGGLATFKGRPCIVLGTFKGHTPQTMQEANYGMASPHGYRFALRLMQMAERFGEDVAIMDNLSVLLLREANSPYIEIIRCPAALRKKPTGAKLG